MLVNIATAMSFCLTNPRCSAGLRGLVSLLLLAAAGCGTMPVKDRNPAITAPVYVGSISVVNTESHFVLIDLSGTAAPLANGTDLTAISAAGVAARLKVTPEKKRPFVTADIVSGTPKRGERVYR